MAQQSSERTRVRTGFGGEEGPGSKGADLDFRYSDGDGLIHRAAIEGASDTVSDLLDQGADIDMEGFKGYTPLQYAAKHGHLQLVRFLLERGADVNRGNDWDWTPLHHAVYYDRRKVIEVLLDAGSDHSAVDNVYGWTPLKWAGHNQRIVNMLKKRGVSR